MKVVAEDFYRGLGRRFVERVPELNFAISDDLTVLKLLKVQRLFHFLSSYAAAHLAEILPKNRPIVFQPLILRLDIAELLASPTQACAVHSPTLSMPAAP